jgi:hypothetical protein
VDAICVGEGETLLPALMRRRRPSVARWIRFRRCCFLKEMGTFRRPAPSLGAGLIWLEMPLPDRSVVARYQKRYCLSELHADVDHGNGARLLLPVQLLFGVATLQTNLPLPCAGAGACADFEATGPQPVHGR